LKIEQGLEQHATGGGPDQVFVNVFAVGATKQVAMPSLGAIDGDITEADGPDIVVYGCAECGKNPRVRCEE
jgi:hypothetical protein